MINASLSLTVILAAALFQEVPKTAVQMSAAEVGDKLRVPVLRWRLLGFPESRIGERKYQPDGTFWWKRLDADYSGTGEWRIEGDELCEKYDPAQSWKGRDWACHPVVANGRYVFFGNTFFWDPRTEDE